jgi:predicted NBD/HSP70 family sugar kinase
MLQVRFSPSIRDGSMSALQRPAGSDAQSVVPDLYSIGIRITQKQLIGLLVDLDGNVVDLPMKATDRAGLGKVTRQRHLEDTDIQTIVVSVRDLVNELLAIRSELRGSIVGLGVSISGHVDGNAGAVRLSPSLSWQKNVPLAHLLEQATGLSVVVENDAKALALAEQIFGRGATYRSFALVKVGNGIGCGLVINNELWRGATGIAGELGHVPWQTNGRPCICGLRGCLQTVASADAIVQATRESGGSNIADIETAAAVALAGDEVVVSAFRRAGEALGDALAMLLNLLNLEAIVLCGEAAVLGSEAYLEAARASLRAHAFSSAADDCELWIEARSVELEARGVASLVFGYSTHPVESTRPQ